MKKALLVIMLTLGVACLSQSKAQQGAVDKKPLIEVFTSSTCPPCVLGNIVVDGVLDKNQGEYSLIKYQMNWPGTGDPYYMEASLARRTYYAVTGVPSLKTNGTDAGYPGYWTQQMYDQLTSKTNMTITGQASVAASPGSNSKSGGMVVSCTFDLTALAAYGTGLRAYAVVTERNTFANATTNGETVFHNVVQGYLLNSDGEALGAMAADQVKSFDLTLDLAGSNVETGNDLRVIIFVQNYATKEVIQSEMIEVSHPFIDYTATFNLFDDDYNPIDGGMINVDLAGTAHAADSKVFLEKLLPGEYNYEIVVPGYLPYTGDFTISDSDLEENLFIEIPPFNFYEDFENEGFPEGWTVVNPQEDYFVQNMGEIVYQKTKAIEDIVFLVLPKISIDQGCVLSFKAGQSQGASHIGIGVVSDPNNPGDSYNEVVNYEIFAIENMRTFGGRLDPQTLGDGYLCLKITADVLNNFFYLDDVILIENMPGYKVQFHVTDQNGDVLPEAEVTFMEETVACNAFGYSSWHDIDAAEYSYSVSYKGEEIETGSLSVDGDMLKEIAYNTSGINTLEKEVIHFYPNPANDFISIAGVTQGKVQIISLDGKVLKEANLTDSKVVKISELPIGVYLVKITAEKQTLTSKLYKSK